MSDKGTTYTYKGESYVSAEVLGLTMTIYLFIIACIIADTVVNF